MNKKGQFLIAFLLLTSIGITQVNAQLQQSTALSSDQYTTANITSHYGADYTSAAINQQGRQTLEVFLNKVAGINMNLYNITSLNVHTSKVPGSQRNQMSISARLDSDETSLYIAMIIIENKVRFYDLSLLSGNLGDAQLSFADSLNAGERAIDNYRSEFNASYCDGLNQIVPPITQPQNLTTTINNKTLKIQSLANSELPLKYTMLTWQQNANNITIPMQSVQATVSRTGIITFFVDTLGVYEVATTNIALSKQQALATAMPYINAYSEENDIEVQRVNATLEYVTDLNGIRGDSYLLYPQWTVSATFVNSNNGVTGYNVLIWADNGEIVDERAQGAFLPRTTEVPSANITIVIITAVAMSGFVVAVINRARAQASNLGGKRKSALKIGVAFALIVGLSSSLLIQPVSANSSTIFGSEDSIPLYELQLDYKIACEIEYWSETYTSLTTYNWYGSSTNADNLYIGAYDHGDAYSAVFYIGHGGTDGFGDYAITDNNGNLIWDYNIWLNSYEQSYGHHKFALLWSCEQGDDRWGMPLSWIHTPYVSNDGYHYPDLDSDLLFIGFNGPGPYLSNTYYGHTNASYELLHWYYYYSLTMWFTANQALDAATSMAFGMGFDQSIFYTGLPDAGNMVVYGDGNICIAYGEDPPVMSWVGFYAPDYWGYDLPVYMYVDNGEWIIPAGQAGQITPGLHTIAFSTACYTGPWPVYYVYTGCDCSSQMPFQWEFFGNSEQSFWTYYTPLY